MAGEHLPLSNYEDLTVEETLDKLKLLVDSGREPNLQAVLDYEETRADSRKGVIEGVQKLMESPDYVPPAVATPAPAPSGDTGDENATKATPKSK
jgi:hypothetical protein